MKKFIPFVFVLILSQYNVAASAESAEATAGQSPLCVVVDPRVELMSIIFRLAGNPEYCQGKVASYTQDVEKHFGEFRTHPAVKLAQKLRKEHGVSYDACMSMAVHLTDTEKCDERVPFDPRPENLDARWSAEGAREFLAAARQFVEDTRFNDFFNDHRSLYETTQARMEEFLDKNAHPEWFDEYFGSRPGASFTLALAMLNGGNCYGARCRAVDGREELYSIIGVWKTDEQGLPVFDPWVLGTIVHEFCHSYVNPLTSKYKTEIDKYAKLFEPISGQMRRHAYPTWEICVNEHIVRALSNAVLLFKSE